MNRQFLFVISFLFCLPGITRSQTSYIDSLENLLKTERDEHQLMRIHTQLGNAYQDNSNPKAIAYYQEALSLAEKLGDPMRAASSYYGMGNSYFISADYDAALDNYLKSAHRYESLKDSFRLSNALMSIANVYFDNNNFEKTDEYHQKAQDLIIQLKDTLLLCDIYGSRGTLSDKKKDYDQAIAFYRKAYALAILIRDDERLTNNLSNLGITYKHQNNFAAALDNFQQVLAIFKKNNTPVYYQSMVYNNIGSTYAELHDYDRAEQAFDQSITYAGAAGAPYILMENYHNVADMYDSKKDYQKQAIFLKKYHALKDSLFSIDEKNQMVQLESDYQIAQKNAELLKKEVEITNQKNQRNILKVIVLSAFFILLALSYFYLRIKKTNQLLGVKNTEINRQKNTLEDTLLHLKTTQAQLIQSEKMASLGELTAGIAHEIQNPLNFVNNFSELNTELVGELIEELKKGNKDEAIDLAKNISDNEQKINHHGKRADAIVKGMLQHSRSSDSGSIVLTDINKLAEEYLRLSYQAHRTKDLFPASGMTITNAEIKMDFDPTLPLIHVIPQDIGKVILNLCNNAFWACTERNIQVAKLQSHHRESDDDHRATIPAYQPSIVLTTLKTDNGIEIRITDNGSGIPDDIKDKIFQPFFTTKPTGQGTGLGLSLSYDIVKAHGGELMVKSPLAGQEEGEGSEFIVSLPSDL